MDENEKGSITVVAPNGAQLEEKYKPHERVGTLLDRAVKDFGKRGDLDPGLAYILVLGDRALDGGLTLDEAGVKPGDTLKVRSKKIPGDGDAPGTL